MKKFLKPSLALASLIALSSGQALACGTEAYVGSICAYGFNYCPPNMVYADGSYYPIKINGNDDPLYKVVGDTYGMNASTGKYAVPDLRGRYLAGAGDIIPIGTQVDPIGSETVTLQANQLPPHSHSTQVGFAPSSVVPPLPATAQFQVSTDGSAASSAAPSTATPYMGIVTAGTDNIPMWTATPNPSVNVGGVTGSADGLAFAQEMIKLLEADIQPTGGGGSTQISIIPPELGITYCIVKSGITPSFD